MRGSGWVTMCSLRISLPFESQNLSVPWKARALERFHLVVTHPDPRCTRI